MAVETIRSAVADGTAEQKPAEKPKRSRSKKALVKQVIQQIGKKLDNDELKPTVGDLIRLLQLEKELLEEAPKEIKVSWVEPAGSEDATEK